MSEKPSGAPAPWSSYAETVLIFTGDPKVTIDLREPVLPPARSALAEMGLAQPFAVVTSFNPRGVVLDRVENERRFAELEAELRSSGHEYLVMDACAPDKSHCERSVAVMIDRTEALRIAVRWDQLAIFWWDLDRFWIYGAIPPVDPPLALPVAEYQN